MDRLVWHQMHWKSCCCTDCLEIIKSCMLLLIQKARFKRELAALLLRIPLLPAGIDECILLHGSCRIANTTSPSTLHLIIAFPTPYTKMRLLSFSLLAIVGVASASHLGPAPGHSVKRREAGHQPTLGTRDGNIERTHLYWSHVCTKNDFNSIMYIYLNCTATLYHLFILLVCFLHFMF